MTENSISQKAIAIKRIQLTLITAVLSFLLGGVFTFSPLISLTVGSLILFLYLYSMLRFIDLWYRSYHYYTDDSCIRIEKGVFLSKKITLFKDKIQYTQFLQTPLERIFQTCTIIYHTAGAVVYLSEIDIDVLDGVVFDEEKI